MYEEREKGGVGVGGGWQIVGSSLTITTCAGRPEVRFVLSGPNVPESPARPCFPHSITIRAKPLDINLSSVSPQGRLGTKVDELENRRGTGCTTTTVHNGEL